MDLDFDNLVLDLMDDIVELEIDIGFDDTVMILVELGNLLLHMAEQLGIGLEVQGLDINVHRKGGLSDRICSYSINEAMQGSVMPK